MYFGFPRLSKSSEKEKQILSSKSQSICSSSLCSACGPHANLKSRIFEAAALMELLHLSPVGSRSWEGAMKNQEASFKSRMSWQLGMLAWKLQSV